MMKQPNMLTVKIDQHGTAGEDDLKGSLSSSSSDIFSDSSSLESDSFEEVTSSSSSSDIHFANDPLSDMSSLIQELPMKRGLSKHYQGKSRSFTSLANVRSLEDLAKQENPYNKWLKTCRSYGRGLGSTAAARPRSSKYAPNRSSRPISKRSGMHSKASCSSVLGSKRNGAGSFIGNKPPIPPHRSTSTSTSTIPNQTALFA